MSSNARKWLAVLVTIVGFYVVHEGAHLMLALVFHVYQGIHLYAFGMLGVQVLIDATALSARQLAVFGVAGSVASLLVAYLLVFMRKPLLTLQSKPAKAIGYYLTVGFLMLDPVNQAVISAFVGGGDVNGIMLFGIPAAAVRLVFSGVGAVNLVICAKVIYPAYKQSFAAGENQGFDQGDQGCQEGIMETKGGSG